MAFELKIECLGNLEPQISNISVIIQEKDWVLLTWDISIEGSVTEIFRDDNFIAVATGNSKNITNLQPGKRYKVSLLPNHNNNKGDFVTFDLEMSPDPPKVHIFKILRSPSQGLKISIANSTVRQVHRFGYWQRKYTGQCFKFENNC